MLSRREAIFLVVLFLASLPAVTTRLYSSDEVQYFSYLRSLWFDHDVSFENEYRYFYDHNIAQTPAFYDTFLVRTEAATGRRINYATMGCAMLWSPFYGVGDLAARAMRAAGSSMAVDGYSRPYVSAVAYGSAFYGWAAVVLAVIAARQAGGEPAVSSGIIVWIGTPLLLYSYIAPPFSHACSAFAVALFVTVWLRVRRDWSPRGSGTVGAGRRVDGDGARAGHILRARGGRRLCGDGRPAAQRSGSQASHPCCTHRSRRIRARIPAAIAGLYRAERQAPAISARRPQDVLARTACPAGARRPCSTVFSSGRRSPCCRLQD